MMNDDDNKNIEKAKRNMREYVDYYLVTGEDNPAGKNDSMERIGEIQDHPLYNLVDGKNKTDSYEKKNETMTILPEKISLTKKISTIARS
jgi:hypothetical protein